MYARRCTYVCYLTHLCILLKPLDGMRCHLVETLVWSQVILHIRQGTSTPMGRGDLGAEPLVRSNATHRQFTVALVA